MTTDSFSVIMPCYKMGRYVSTSVESVLNQSHPNWELVAIDDGGPDDGTEETVRMIKNRSQSADIRWIKLSQNVGVSQARNVAAQEAKYEYLAFLDPDDIWATDHLRNSFEILDANPEIDLVCSPVKAFRGDGPLNTANLWAFASWQRDFFPYSLGIYNFIQPSGVCIRKSAFNQVGGFKQGLFFAEDYDLWIRLAKNGKRFRLLDESTCFYRLHADAATSDKVLSSRGMKIFNDLHDEFLSSSSRMVCLKSIRRLEQLESCQAGPVFQFLHRCDRFVGRIFSRNR